MREFYSRSHRVLAVMMSVFLLVLVSEIQAQDRKISGRITDELGEGIPGASVLIKGTSNGSITDINGAYRLSVAEDATLIISFIGYATEEVVVGSRSVIDLQMQTDVTALQEVVVVGYGEQQKSVMTAAIASIKAKDLANYSAGGVQQSMQGRVSGLQVIPNGGSPGSGIKVRVRGTGSNSNSEPLYIVDGLRVPNLDWLDPFEIGSIEVLKDAASAAIYGAEGANGVVLVSTKTGKAGKGKLNYDFQYGIQSFNSNLNVMDLSQFDAYNAEAGISRDADEVVPSEGTDWIDEIFNNAPQQRHALSFSGGSDKSSYYISGNYFSQEGIVGGEKSKYERVSLRMNGNHEINDWLKVGHRASYAHFERNSIRENDEFGGIAQNGILMDPASPVTYSGGIPTFILDTYGADQNYLTNGNGDFYGLSTLVNGEIVNPIAAMASRNGGSKTDLFAGVFDVTATPIKGLEITSRIGVVGAFFQEHIWNRSYFFTPTSASTNSNATDIMNRNFNYQWENWISYSKDFNRNKVSFLAGTSIIAARSTFLQANSNNLFIESDELSYPSSIPNRIQNTDALGNETLRTLNSYFGRLQYNYDDKYLLNATVRADGSSLLADGNRWGVFPAISAGWIMSNETFLKDITPISVAKLRASWGLNGSLSNLSVGEAVSLVEPNFIYVDAEGNFLTGAEPTSLSNPDLTWETSEQLNIGLDMGFFDNRLTLTADYFIKETRDLLTIGTPPSFIGNAPTTVNSGTVENKGVELALGYREQAKELKYEINFNFTAIKNKVTFLDPNKLRDLGANVGTNWTGATAFEVGLPVWYFRGYQTDGVFQNSAEIAEYKAEVPTGYDPEPGDVIIRDVNGDGVITDSDQTMIGSPHPDFIFGTTVKLDYKNFDFTLFVQGSVGNDVIMGFNRTDRISANKPEFFYTDRWTGEGSTNDWFRAGVNPLAYASDFMVFDGSFVRVKQIQLGYNVPSGALEKVGVSKLRLYVSLDNFITLTKYQGFDPEVGGSTSDNSQGIDRGLYPNPQVFLTGLSVSF